MRDRGSAAVEAAIAFPGLVLVGLVLFAGMQVMTARSQVQAAARSAARAAATAGSQSQARSRGEQSVASSFASGSTCVGAPTPTVDGFGAGQTVRVTVSCQANTVFSSVIGPVAVTGEATEFMSGVLGGTN